MNLIKEQPDNNKRSTALLYLNSLIEDNIVLFTRIGIESKMVAVNAVTEKITGYCHKLMSSDFSTYFTESEKAHQHCKEVNDNSLITDHALTISHRNAHISKMFFNINIYNSQAGEAAGIL